jgi:hypothetical protein
MKNLTMTEKVNNKIVAFGDNKTSSNISLLFEEVKQIYKSAENNRGVNPISEKEVLRIQSEFRIIGDEKGVLFCCKALSIIDEKRGDAEIELTVKIKYYEAAHEHIVNAVILGENIKWKQPSILKRLAIIKTKLGDALHQLGDHFNANILESDSLKIFGRMLYEKPDYAEGHLEKITAYYSKLKWSLGKILHELSITENLFNKPIHTKHQPDTTELQCYKKRIETMRSTVNLILAIIH